MKIKLYNIIFSAIFFCNFSFAQNDPNDVFHEINDDQIVYYFSSSGNLSLKSKCDYYRILKYPPITFPFSDTIADYYKSGKIAFKGFIRDGYFDDNCEYFYENGNLKVKGTYKKGKRIGVWEFYYENSQLEKRLIYKNDRIYIIDTYKKSGKQLIENGYGKFSGIVKLGQNPELIYKMTGKVEDSLMNGKWILGTETDFYKVGGLIKGSGICQNSFFSNFENDKFNIFTTEVISEKFSNTPLYNDSNSINKLISELKKHIIDINNKNLIQTHWSIASFIVDKNDNLINCHVISSEPIIQDFLTSFIKGLKWKAANEIIKESVVIFTHDDNKDNKEYLGKDLKKLRQKDKLDTYIYIPIICIDNEVTIPKYSSLKHTMNNYSK